MNEKLKTTGWIFLLLIMGGIIAYTRFTNIDMSEMRILVTFWRRWIVVLAIGLFALWFGCQE